MLYFIAILFILAVTFFIGWRVSRNVPDELERAAEYLHLGIDALLVIIVSMALYGLGYAFAALFAVVLIFARKLFAYLYAPLSGAILGMALLMEQQVQIIIFVLALLLNFLIGAVTVKQRTLIVRNVWQPVVALLLAGILLLANLFK